MYLFIISNNRYLFIFSLQSMILCFFDFVVVLFCFFLTIYGRLYTHYDDDDGLIFSYKLFAVERSVTYADHIFCKKQCTLYHLILMCYWHDFLIFQGYKTLTKTESFSIYVAILFHNKTVFLQSCQSIRAYSEG